MKYQRDENRVYFIAYHIVVCTTHRQTVLVEDVAKGCDEFIHQLCTARGWEVLLLDIQPDYVHLYVQVYPTTSADDVAKLVKRRTTGELRQKYPLLRRYMALWNRSYFVSTENKVDAKMLESFLDTQRAWV